MAICKHFSCLPTDDRFKNLSFYQKIILYNSVVEEKKDTAALIKQCFLALQPWLDKDMYSQINQIKDNARVNSAYGAMDNSGDSIDVE